jgi:P-type Ca2+ transporter type 2C
MGLLTLGTGYWYWSRGLDQWQTMVFLTLTLAQIANVLAIRSERDSFYQIGLFSNKPMLGAVVLTFVLQLAVIYVPFLQGFFNTVPLSALDLAIGLAISSIVFWVVELEKWLTR